MLFAPALLSRFLFEAVHQLAWLLATFSQQKKYRHLEKNIKDRFIIDSFLFLIFNLFN